ncbi:choice-of-anchor A family protein [Nocardioides soli]|uniref:Choice-of-anchor A domain-containing protein/uncharacterized repeat protein (TIGR01451 family) n=1 Tax=Nocardioides soli TaxID=1036020 RepID=A0A7W4VVB1_9ACTN|nr:choice-of-anchor A domain-containing protein/uncharacterized repeat protein (TIGR01451 family) [Nocardioides soli]
MFGSTLRPRALRAPVLALAVLMSGGLAAVTPGTAAATGITCTSDVATSNALGPATGWTEFVETDGSRGAESEGAIAYGGNLPTAMTVGTHLTGYAASAPALVVAGTHGQWFNLSRGSAYVSPQSGVNFNGGGHYLPGNPVDFGAAFTELRALSTSWGAAPATGTVTTGTVGGNSGALVLTGTSGSLNVFTLSPAQAAQLAGGAHVGYDVPSGAVTIVNVPGTSVGVAGQAWIGSGSSWSQASDGNVKGVYNGIVWNFPDATSVTLDYGSAWVGHLLAPRAAVQVVGGGHNIGQVIARSFASSRETHLNLFPSQACVPTPPDTPGTSDVTITKSASTTNPHGGDTVVYTLTATNVGNAVATGVVIRDELPAGVTFVSASAPCAQAAGVVTCQVGSLAPGASVTKKITVTATPIAGAGPGPHSQATHWLTPYKAEAQVDLEAGQQRTVTLGCAPGDYLSDGQFRVDHVDQGTGTIRDVRVLASRSDSASTWKGVIRNDATGRAQAKAFIVCLPQRTEANGHRHGLSEDAAVPSLTQSYAAGRHSATLTCPTGTVPIAPGFDLSSASAELVGSEYSTAAPRKWTFTLDVTAPVTATYTARCLRTTVDPVNGHTHELRFTHVVQTVSVPGHTAPEGTEYQVICPDDAKGVVATFDLPPGVRHVGNDPRLKARAFRLFNDTGTAQQATIDLVCLHDRTGSGQSGSPDPVEVVNTATVSSASVDANPANNAAAATVTVRPGSATAGASGFLRVGRGKAKVSVVSALPGKAKVRVKARGAVVAQGKVKLRPGLSVVARLKLTKAAKRTIVRAGKVRVVVDPARGKRVQKVVKVRR